MKEEPATPETPSNPEPPTQGEIFISTVRGASARSRPATRRPGRSSARAKPASKVWEIADFSAVSIGSTFRAEISRGDRFKVSTSSDDNVLKHLSVVKEGKTLKIGLEKGWSYQLKEPLKAEVVLPVLEALDAGGASKATIKGFRSEQEFKLKLHGASTIDGALEVGNADLRRQRCQPPDVDRLGQGRPSLGQRRESSRTGGFPGTAV